MKKLTRRAFSALIVAAAVLLGLTVYVVRFARHSGEWVSYSANQSIFKNGMLIAGTVTDRTGLELAGTDDGKRIFAGDALVRTACLHAVGDAEGNIGTGALRQFSGRLSGYNRGAVLLADYTTGEILCMTSSPSYDPAVGFDSANPYYDSVYINRALGAAYVPGSVFKLVTTAAALENIGDLYERTFFCSGSVTVDGSVLNCSGVHGQQTVEQALANSCNCAFAELGLELGGDTLKKYADKLGFTEQLSVSGIATAAGSFDAAPDGSPALAWSGIGQSTDLVSPIALLRYVCAVANGGTAHEPTVLLGESGGKTRLLSADTADALKSMMHYNVAAVYGTWNFPNLNLCAKSGTAEQGDGTSHAWFTGFLDDEAHPYAFVVVIEGAGGGLANAGPVANTVLQAAVAK